MSGKRDDVDQGREDAKSVTSGEMHDDLTWVHIGSQRRGHLGQRIIGDGENEEVAGPSHFRWRTDAYAGQQRLGAHPRDVAAG
jgi:hypothetical protein